jgi:hypothetical protein
LAIFFFARGFAPRTYLQTNSLNWLDSPRDNLVHPCNTLAGEGDGRHRPSLSAPAAGRY